jgi:hypothetical protein
MRTATRSTWLHQRTEYRPQSLAAAIVNRKTPRTGRSGHRTSKKTELAVVNPPRLRAQGSEAATPANEPLKTRAQASNAISSAGASSRTSFKSTPLSFLAPRTASRWAVAITAAAEYRPCSASSRDGDASLARQEQSTRHFCRHRRARHNPSLNHRTRYGGPSWPGLGYAVHSPSPGQAVPPQRSG